MHYQGDSLTVVCRDTAMKNTKYHKNSALFLIVLVLTSSSVAGLAIRNYDNDPDLARALRFGRAGTSNKSKTERELAEKNYLEYLKKDIPSFQKARVYFMLGNLYTVGSDPRNGIMPDNEKGDRYLEKVLQLEPERIDSATIRARTLLASSPILSREERLQKRLDVYEWLSSLDEEKFQKFWLPLEPEQQAILPITLKSLQNYVPKVKHAQAVNSVASAAHMPDREARLAEIIGRFPDTEIADMARDLLKYQLTEVRGSIASILAMYRPRNGLTPESGTKSVNLESQTGEMRQEESTPPEKSSAQVSNDVSVLADIPPIGERTHTVWRVYALIICAVLMGCLLFYVARRVKHSERKGES